MPAARTAPGTVDDAVRCVRRPPPRCQAARVVDAIRADARSLGDPSTAVTARSATRVFAPALTAPSNTMNAMAAQARAIQRVQVGRGTGFITSTDTRSRFGIQAVGARWPGKTSSRRLIVTLSDSIGVRRSDGKSHSAIMSRLLTLRLTRSQCFAFPLLVPALHKRWRLCWLRLCSPAT